MSIKIDLNAIQMAEVYIPARNPKSKLIKNTSIIFVWRIGRLRNYNLYSKCIILFFVIGI